MLPSVSQLQDDLNRFTDVFGDEVVEENFSQPLSFATTCDTQPESITNGTDATGVKPNRPLKHTGQHGEFRSVEEIDEKYRCLFTYPYFNLVQSRIIDDALYSDKSMVVCAPTGSGKTVVFELAILQLLMQMEDAQCSTDFKIIYMAPVKAVCNERLTEWYPKLTKLGLLCVEVTGDTEVDFAQLKPYRVIITTPEKWDMLTRRWRDHRGLVEMIKLFLIDEVHILNDETRGPVLEAVVSRMKTVESAAQSAHRIEQLQRQYQGMQATHSAPPRIRFVAVSATVSNPEDVADWLGTSEKPAVFYKFGDECRPVKLQRIVEGYPCAEGTSIFKFDIILNYKLWPIIQKYYNGKPTLIFCNTRKSVTLTAETLSREVTVGFNPEQKAKLTALASTIKNKKLQMLIMSGVGCHHAGMLYEERVNIERAFRNRDLPILITTTTLAMGVNLPAHLVIVKNTQQYVNGAYQEYSISTVLQMVGRAGRPQFDTEATAVIMTRLCDKPRYQALVGGSEPLQSFLHKRIAENLNSEAALGTVTDVAQCVEWLRSTFLYVRAAKDPKRYLGLPTAAPMQLILKKIEELCVKAMNSLASSGLITMDEASCIESTEAGRLMSLFYLDVETMKNIMKIEGSETLERLLWLVCESHELSDMHLRVDERRTLNLLNRNNQAATIRFPMKGKISTRQMKLNCIIQAILGCLPIPDPSLNQEAMKVIKTASRVCKCLVRYVTHPDFASRHPKCFRAVLNAILLSKCIEAHLWENSPYVSKQLKGIGPTFSTLLATAGVTTFMLLDESHPRDLERIMNKGPPAGNLIRKQVSLLPKYQLTVTPIDSRSVSVQLNLLNHAHLSENMNTLTAGDSHKSYIIVGDSGNNLLLLTQFTDNDLISVYDGTMRYEIARKLRIEHKILIHCVSSVIVGIDAQADYLFLDLEPQVPRESEFFISASLQTKGVNVKQTAITDVYKERKRKCTGDNEITQSKEKKKREDALTQKIKALKDSFGKTSKALKQDIDKSAKISKEVMHDLLDGKNINNNTLGQVVETITVEDETPLFDLTTHDLSAPLEEIIINDDDDIDDSQIDSILSKIESEITGTGSISSKIHTHEIQDIVVATEPNTTKSIQKFQNNEDTNKIYNFIDRPSSNRFESRKRKNINRSNFSCIDLIEKKANIETGDVVVSVDKNNGSGFSDTIKSQINQFIQRAKNKSKSPISEINHLLHTPIHEELPVHVKTPLTFEQDKSQEVDEENPIGAIYYNEIDEYEKNVSNINKSVEELGHENTNLTKSDVKCHVQRTETNNTEILQECILEVQSIDNDLIEDINFKCDKQNMNIGHNIEKNSKDDENDDGLFITEHRNKHKILNTLANFNDKHNIIVTSYSTVCQLLPPKTSNKENENAPVNGFENIIDNDESQSHNMLPYRYQAQTECDNHRQDNRYFGEPLVPYADINEPVQYIVKNGDTKMADKRITKCNKQDICETIQVNSNGKQETREDKSCNDIKVTEHCSTVCEKIQTPTHYNYRPDQYTLSSNKTNFLVPSKLLRKENEDATVNNITDEISNNEMVPYSNDVKTARNNNNPNNLREALVPYRRVSQSIQNIPDYDNTTMANKSVTLYENNHPICQHTPYGISSVNTLKQMIDFRDINFQPSFSNEISIHDNIQPYNHKSQIPCNIPPIYKRNSEHLDERTTRNDYCNNSEEPYIKKISYTSTKVDVCTKKYTADHDLRITRKLKIDVDMEIVTQDKGKTNEYTTKEHGGIIKEQHKETKQSLFNYNKNSIEHIGTDKHSPTEDLILRKEQLRSMEESSKYSSKKNTIGNILQTDRHNHKNKINNEIDGHSHTEDLRSKEMPLQRMGENPKYSSTNDCIGNILQKYSKILVKRESNTPVVNMINRNTDSKTTVVTKTPEFKSRKPFKISQINDMDVPLPEILTNSGSALNTTTILKPIPTVKHPFNEFVSNAEVNVPNVMKISPKMCDDNDRSYASPVSVHSLELDPIEDIKNETMFDPKLLLQHFREDKEETTDIIAPPAAFCDEDFSSCNDNIQSELRELHTGHLQNFYDEMESRDQRKETFNELENFDNNSYFDETTNVQPPKRDIETWCLSRDKDDLYTSQVSQPSVPWNISQTLPISQAKDGLRARRGNLCHFKFVRKKPLQF